ncbi:MAG: hypothetical protein CVU96_00695 [Firmicutes bacterium HGW-Firmicutes-20]|nr:MAG: hypothetical protein CVU96_00695 [Firmicutes bacterium HGW-Firmicutes-20]PKM86697.1 MAG: hypothetical protein CVU85_07370 [Firmicutes bacterium HGW-Firmicutes-10]
MNFDSLQRNIDYTHILYIIKLKDGGGKLMKNLFDLIINVAIFSFIIFVLFKTISSFKYFYRKNSKLVDNKLGVFFVSFVLSLVYGFVAISGASPDDFIKE